MDILIINSIDNKYRANIKELNDYFTEFGNMRFRIYVEIEYIINLIQTLPELSYLVNSSTNFNILRNLYTNFNDKEARKIKQIDSRLNDEVKSIEYYLRTKFDEISLSTIKEYIHFGIDSSDIINTSYILQLKSCITNVYNPNMQHVLTILLDIIGKWSNIVCVKRYHHQPICPTILGKELMVFYERLLNELSNLNNVKYTTKFGGIVGNFNELHISCPEVDWPAFADKFITNLGLQRNKYTSHTDHYDNYAVIFDSLRRVNNILINFIENLCDYIIYGYFKPKTHRIYQSDFKTTEENLSIANDLFSLLSNKLPISESPMTLLKNIGPAFAHTLLSFKTLVRNVSNLDTNLEMIQLDVNNNWIIISDGIQSILRRAGSREVAELLKQYVHSGEIYNKERMELFINSLQIDATLKQKLLSVTPYNFYGIIK